MHYFTHFVSLKIQIAVKFNILFVWMCKILEIFSKCNHVWLLACHKDLNVEQILASESVNSEIRITSAFDRLTGWQADRVSIRKISIVVSVSPSPPIFFCMFAEKILRRDITEYFFYSLATIARYATWEMYNWNLKNRTKCEIVITRSWLVTKICRNSA